MVRGGSHLFDRILERSCDPFNMCGGAEFLLRWD